VASERVTVSDLEAAATWLEYYEADPGDEVGDGCRRVALWLRKEAERRQRADTVVLRQFVRQTGASMADARRMLAKIRARG
jgi:hypothetical protein